MNIGVVEVAAGAGVVRTEGLPATEDGLPATEDTEGQLGPPGQTGTEEVYERVTLAVGRGQLGPPGQTALTV